jgi:hypothetical protein
LLDRIDELVRRDPACFGPVLEPGGEPRHHSHQREQLQRHRRHRALRLELDVVDLLDGLAQGGLVGELAGTGGVEERRRRVAPALGDAAGEEVEVPRVQQEDVQRLIGPPGNIEAFPRRAEVV